MKATQKNKDLAALYTIRAGVSQIAIECDVLDELREKRQGALDEIAEQERIHNEQKKWRKKELQDAENKVKEIPLKRNRIIHDKNKFIAKIICFAVLSLAVVVGAVLLEYFFWADWRNLLLPFSEMDLWDGKNVVNELLQILGYIAGYGGAVLAIPFVITIALISIIKYVVILSEDRFDDLQWVEDSYQQEKNAQAIIDESNQDGNSKYVDEYWENLEQQKEQYDALIYLHGARMEAIYAALQKQYGAFLGVRDWKYVDLLIYAYETGRADSMKEALLFVDGERRLNNILQAVELANKQVCESIQAGLSQINQVMEKGFKLLSEQMEKNNAVQQAQLNVINENLCTSVQLVDYNNALQEKQTVTMERMIEQTTQNLNKLC